MHSQPSEGEGGASELKEWLQTHNLTEYYSKFVESEFQSPKDLKGFTREDIKELCEILGITSFGKKSRLRQAISALNKNSDDFFPLTTEDFECIKKIQTHKKKAEETAEWYEQTKQSVVEHREKASTQLGETKESLNQQYDVILQDIDLTHVEVDKIIAACVECENRVRKVMRIDDLEQMPQRSKTIQSIAGEAFALTIPTTDFKSRFPNIDFLRQGTVADINLTVHITTGDIEMKICISPVAKLSEVRGIIARNYPGSIVGNQMFKSTTGQQFRDEQTLAECGLGNNSKLFLRSKVKQTRQNLENQVMELQGELNEAHRLIDSLRNGGGPRHGSESMSSNQRNYDRNQRDYDRHGGRKNRNNDRGRRFNSGNTHNSSPKTSTISQSNATAKFGDNAVSDVDIGPNMSSARDDGAGVPPKLVVSGAEEYNGTYLLQRENWNSKPLYKKANNSKCIRWFRNAWLIDDEVRDEPLGVAVWRRQTRHPGAKNQEWIVFKDNQWTDCSELRVTPVWDR